MQLESSSPFILSNKPGYGTSNQDNYALPDQPASKLYDRVAFAAIRNSMDQHVDAPKCHPETREAVQQDIHRRLSHRNGGHIWLTGPAGSGKTAIVGSVCDRFEQEGRLAATFYFSSYNKSRKSKQNFVTTLAHQLQQHEEFKDHISAAMLSAIQRNPSIFEKTLAEQADTLILQPFRSGNFLHSPTFTSPSILAVDGIDECEGDHDTYHDRSRQEGQLEVLRALLTLANDSSFPCRIIIASRPEAYIRRFFEDSAAGRFQLIFLDDRYDPYSDLRLYYQSQFSRISLKYGYNASEWLREQDLGKLVENASGQFIYAATVIRFVDSAWPLPTQQLKLVLNVKPPVAGSSPFHILDNLYTTIIKNSPCPDVTILWLQGIRVVRGIMPQPEGGVPIPSRDFIDPLFESGEHRAKEVLALPSLIDADYRFYHKSFNDYLKDTARSGIAFPGLDHSSVNQWLAERISKVVECGGPEVQLPPEAQNLFRSTFTTFWMSFWLEHTAQSSDPLISQDILAKSSPEIWLSPPSRHGHGHPDFVAFVYVFVHSECRSFGRCWGGCRRWRKAIMQSSEYRSYLAARWSSDDLFADRLGFRRIRWTRVDVD